MKFMIRMEIYYEESDGYWYKNQFDVNGNEIILKTQMWIGLKEIGIKEI